MSTWWHLTGQTRCFTHCRMCVVDRELWVTRSHDASNYKYYSQIPKLVIQKSWGTCMESVSAIYRGSDVFITNTDVYYVRQSPGTCFPPTRSGLAVSFRSLTYGRLPSILPQLASLIVRSDEPPKELANDGGGHPMDDVSRDRQNECKNKVSDPTRFSICVRKEILSRTAIPRRSIISSFFFLS